MVDFWAIVGSSVLATDRDVGEALGRISGRLASLGPFDLRDFQEDLRRFLFLLDRRTLAEIPVEFQGVMREQTSDHFLYARCACILGGRAEFEKVLVSDSAFAPFVRVTLQGAELLLYLALEAFEQKVGVEMSEESDYSLEWGSNPDGW